MEVNFYYGVMKSSKSAKLIIDNSDYVQRNIDTIIIKPSIDTKDSVKYIKSRVGIKVEADITLTKQKSNVDFAYKLFERAKKNDSPILIDEVQFIDISFLKTLIFLIQNYNTYNSNVELKLYGLLKTYKGNLFPTSKMLVECVDSMVEIKTQCEYQKCNKKATYTYLSNVKQNDLIQIGDSEYHIYCPKHFYLKNGTQA